MIVSTGDILIHEAFPTLSQLELGRLLPECRDVSLMSIADVLKRPHASRLFDLITKKLFEQEDRRWDELLPGLLVLADQPIHKYELPIRFQNRLKGLGWVTWSHVGRETTAGLLRISGVGRGTIKQLLRTSVRQAYLVSPEQLTIERTETNESPPNGGQAISSAFRKDLRRLLRWLWAVQPNANLHDILDPSFKAAPSEITDAAHRINEMTWRDILPQQKPFDLPQALEGFWIGMASRDRQIIESRLGVPLEMTLEQLGKKFDLTRERVRQIECRADAKLRSKLEEKEHRPLVWLLQQVRQELGIGWPLKYHKDRADWVRNTTTCESLSERSIDLLLWLAGPYQKVSSDWVALKTLPGREAIEHLIGSTGRVDVVAVDALLIEAGLGERWHEIWRSVYLSTRCILDVEIIWPGSLVDGLAYVLDVLDRPATTEEMLEACGESAGVRSTRARLLEDHRFVRVDKQRIGLAVWGMAEYDGIASSIAQEIERRGGEAQVETLVETIVHQFAARPESVRMYTNAPLFVNQDGLIRLRDGEPFNMRDNPQRHAGFSVEGERLTWVTNLDQEMMRGSGRPMPEDFFGWLKMMPGDRKHLLGEFGKVSLSWVMTNCQPTLGSIRAEILGHEFQLGERVGVCIDRTTETLRMFRAADDG